MFRPRPATIAVFAGVLFLLMLSVGRGEKFLGQGGGRWLAANTGAAPTCVNGTVTCPSGTTIDCLQNCPYAGTAQASFCTQATTMCNQASNPRCLYAPRNTAWDPVCVQSGGGQRSSIASSSSGGGGLCPSGYDCRGDTANGCGQSGILPTVCPDGSQPEWYSLIDPNKSFCSVSAQCGGRCGRCLGGTQSSRASSSGGGGGWCCLRDGQVCTSMSLSDCDAQGGFAFDADQGRCNRACGAPSQSSSSSRASSAVSSARSSSAASVVCGNGRQESGEKCDDGNTKGGDCCSATCTVEIGCACAPTGASSSSDLTRSFQCPSSDESCLVGIDYTGSCVDVGYGCAGSFCTSMHITTDTCGDASCSGQCMGVTRTSDDSFVMSGCSDTDGGNVPATKGTVTYVDQPFTDFCKDSTTVYEYYCSGCGNSQCIINLATHKCAPGASCSDGAC